MKFRKLVVLYKIEEELKKEELLTIADTVKIYAAMPKNQMEAARRARDADALFSGSRFPITEGFIKACPDLRYIGLFSTGRDQVDLRCAQVAGITVANAPGYSTNAVAEFTFGQMIAMLRSSKEADETMRDGKFSCLAGEELAGKSLGIIGMGAIGGRVAELALAFGMRVAYYSRTRHLAREKSGVLYKSLRKLLEWSDILTLHAELNEQTKGMIGENEILQMREGSVLVNMSRGKLVTREALLLAQRRLRGVILDAYDIEPLPIDDPIRRMRNVLLSPHMAWYTRQSIKRLEHVIVASAKDFLKNNARMHSHP